MCTVRYTVCTSPGRWRRRGLITVSGEHTAYRRKINTEEKAVVVADVWGTAFIKFLAAPAILH